MVTTTPKATPAQADAAIAKQSVRFVLNDLHAGSIAEIMDATYGDLVTPPLANVLQTGLSTQNATENNTQVSEVGAYARWEVNAQTYPRTVETVASVLQQTQLQKVTSYVKADVTAYLDGQTSTYKVLWLFQGNTLAATVDMNSGGGIRDISKVSAYPHVLLETKTRSNPIIAGWITTHSKTGAACTATQTSECCDLAQLSCGIHPSDVTASLTHPPARLQVDPTPAVPTTVPATVKPKVIANDGGNAPSCTIYSWAINPAGANWKGSDANGHISLNHSLYSEDWSGCDYSNPPDPSANQCVVSAWSRTQAYMHEDGSVNWPYSHFVSANQIWGTANAGGGATATATALFGGAVNSCLFGVCGSSASVPPLGLSGSSIWSPVVPSPQSCGPQTVPIWAVNNPPDPTPSPCMPDDPSCGGGGGGDQRRRSQERR